MPRRHRRSGGNERNARSPTFTPSTRSRPIPSASPSSTDPSAAFSVAERRTRARTSLSTTPRGERVDTVGSESKAETRSNVNAKAAPSQAAPSWPPRARTLRRVVPFDSVVRGASPERHHEEGGGRARVVDVRVGVSRVDGDAARAGMARALDRPEGRFARVSSVRLAGEGRVRERGDVRGAVGKGKGGAREERKKRRLRSKTSAAARRLAAGRRRRVRFSRTTSSDGPIGGRSAATERAAGRTVTAPAAKKKKSTTKVTKVTGAAAKTASFPAAWRSSRYNSYPRRRVPRV